MKVFGCGFAGHPARLNRSLRGCQKYPVRSDNLAAILLLAPARLLIQADAQRRLGYYFVRQE